MTLESPAKALRPAQGSEETRNEGPALRPCLCPEASARACPASLAATTVGANKLGSDGEGCGSRTSAVAQPSSAASGGPPSSSKISQQNTPDCPLHALTCAWGKLDGQNAAWQSFAFCPERGGSHCAYEFVDTCVLSRCVWVYTTTDVTTSMRRREQSCLCGSALYQLTFLRYVCPGLCMSRPSGEELMLVSSLSLSPPTSRRWSSARRAGRTQQIKELRSLASSADRLLGAKAAQGRDSTSATPPLLD